MSRARPGLRPPGPQISPRLLTIHPNPCAQLTLDGSGACDLRMSTSYPIELRERAVAASSAASAPMIKWRSSLESPARLWPIGSRGSASWEPLRPALEVAAIFPRLSRALARPRRGDAGRDQLRVDRWLQPASPAQAPSPPLEHTTSARSARIRQKEEAASSREARPVGRCAETRFVQTTDASSRPGEARVSGRILRQHERPISA